MVRGVLCLVALLAPVLAPGVAVASGQVVGLREPYEDVFVAVRGRIPAGTHVVGIRFYSNDATVFPEVCLEADAPSERALPERGSVLRSVTGVSAEPGPTTVNFEPYDAQTDEFVWAVVRFPPQRPLRAAGRGGGPGIGWRPERLLDEERSLFGVDGSVNEFSPAFDITLATAQPALAKAGGGDAPFSEAPPISAVLGRTTLAVDLPNPVRGFAAIELTLERTMHVRLDVYDIVGRRVRSITDGAVGAGVHRRQWDGRNENGVSVASGVYFVVLRAGREPLRQKLTLIR